MRQVRRTFANNPGVYVCGILLCVVYSAYCMTTQVAGVGKLVTSGEKDVLYY